MNVIFFRLIEVSTKKGRKTASMRVAHCCNSFPFFFSVDTSINRTNIRFISYHLIFNAFRDGKHLNIFVNPFYVVEIHVTSQYSF